MQTCESNEILSRPKKKENRNGKRSHRKAVLKDSNNQNRIITIANSYSYNKTKIKNVPVAFKIQTRQKSKLESFQTQ